MKIIALQAENLKRLTAVEIRPDGNIVEITGRNGQGKTSVLDAIWWALEGTRNIQTEPIRNGAQTALVKLDLGEIRVTRKFNRKEEGGFTTTLTVEREDGSRFDKPQSVLDALLGELSFDPLAFTRMKPDEQFERLKSFVHGVDFEAIEQANSKDYERRTTVNRQAKELRAQADGITLPQGKVPELVDVAELESRIADAAREAQQTAQRRANREAAGAKIRELDAEIEALMATREEIKKKLAEADPLPEVVDVTELQAKLTAAREGNVVATSARNKADLEAQARDAEEESAKLTKAMEARERELEEAVSKAHMPIPGLGFGKDDKGGNIVLLNGVPFEQASDAEQLRASIAIAGALNPELRVIRVRDGSLLDDLAMQSLAAYAEEHDLQIWIERVDSSGRVGFVLEDGHLRTAADAETI